MMKSKHAAFQKRDRSTREATTHQTKHRSAATLDELREAIRSLSDADRATLFKSSGAEVRREQIVLIHDWKRQPHDDISFPRAEVIFDKFERQQIDIIATVRANAASIGHPAILCAIKRWEHFVISQSKLPGIGREILDESAQDRAEPLRIRIRKLTHFAKIAEIHLRDIGASLLQGAQRNAWPKELAFKKHKRHFKESYRYLRLVFEVQRRQKSGAVSELIAGAIADFRDTGFIDDPVPSGAITLPDECFHPGGVFWIGFEEIRSFLETSGRRLLEAKRQRYDAWVSGFDAWRFDIHAGTHRGYRATADQADAPPRQDAGDCFSPLDNHSQLKAAPAAFALPIVPPKIFPHKK